MNCDPAILIYRCVIVIQILGAVSDSGQHIGLPVVFTIFLAPVVVLTFSLQREFLPKTSVLLSGIRSKLLFAQIPLFNLFLMTFVGSRNIPQLANH